MTTVDFLYPWKLYNRYCHITHRICKFHVRHLFLWQSISIWLIFDNVVIYDTIRQVLLICHVKSDLICDENLSLLCFCFLRGDKKTVLLIENIFCTNKNVFLSPLKKQKQRSDKFSLQITSLFSWQINRTCLIVS